MDQYEKIINLAVENREKIIKSTQEEIDYLEKCLELRSKHAEKYKEDIEKLQQLRAKRDELSEKIKSIFIL